MVHHEKRWLTDRLADREVLVLNLGDPEYEADVIEEIQAGKVDVYYDTRWETSRVFSNWLVGNCGLLRGKSVLVLGCGIGLEALAVAGFARELFCNDLSPVACKWNRLQLQANGFDARFLPGSYLDQNFPDVDLVVGSFLVYNEETARSMQGFVKSMGCQAILANGGLQFWDPFMKSLGARVDEVDVNGISVATIRKHVD